jgi:hypothetical protein
VLQWTAYTGAGRSAAVPLADLLTQSTGNVALDGVLLLDYTLVR